jgi:hypothetical protein
VPRSQQPEQCFLQVGGSRRCSFSLQELFRTVENGAVSGWWRVRCMAGFCACACVHSRTGLCAVADAAAEQLCVVVVPSRHLPAAAAAEEQLAPSGCVFAAVVCGIVVCSCSGRVRIHASVLCLRQGVPLSSVCSAWDAAHPAAWLQWRMRVESSNQLFQGQLSCKLAGVRIAVCCDEAVL